MSLSGAMNTAVSGLNAQSKALGNISDNVANQATTGYKRVETSFVSLITQATPQSHAPGGVLSRPLYVNDVQGTMQTTSIETNLAIAGEGMFEVRQKIGSAVTGGAEFASGRYFTRAGDFSMDKDGYLVNGSGYCLCGWDVDQTTGEAQKNFNPVPIQVTELKDLPRATTTVDLTANLPTQPDQTFDSDTATLTFNTGGVATSNALNGLSVTVTAYDNATPPGTTPYTFTFKTVPAVPSTTDVQVGADFDESIANLITKLQENGMTAEFTADTAAIPLETLAISSPFGIQGVNFTALNVPAGTVSAATVDTTAENIQTGAQTVTVYDGDGTDYPLDLYWTSDPLSPNTWFLTMRFNGGPSSSPANVIVFNTTNDPVTGAQAGSIYSIDGVVGGTGADPASITLDLTLPTLDPAALPSSQNQQTITLNFGIYGDAQQLTNFAGTDIEFGSVTQNGLPPGSFHNLSIGDDGMLTVNYDNGNEKIYNQIPIVQFSNYNGLQSEAGNAYSASPISGGPVAKAPGENGTGAIHASTVEGSNVDISAELVKMIQAQSAYSANARVISVANEMLKTIEQVA